MLEATESAICVLTVCQADTDTCESEVTVAVVIGNVTEVFPAGMVTLPGTVRMPQLDWSRLGSPSPWRALGETRKARRTR